MSKILEFYSGKTILISGATGFVGKVLLERILSTIPDFKRIYLLLRPKRGQTTQERLNLLLSDPIFSFNSITKAQKDKVQLINADLSKFNLDLSEDDRDRIISEVSIVIHVAASIRFNLKVEDALKTNTLSTKTLLELCIEIKNLKSIVHVSTTFCNIDKNICEEKVYDFVNIDVNQILESLKTEGKLNAIENDLIRPHPNTYTFSKRLAEIVARDFNEKLPITIVRPAIVGPSYKEPYLGWIDRIRGMGGLVTAYATGVTRMFYATPDNCPDITPVDCVANLIIASSYHRTLQGGDDIPVYNITQIDKLPENNVKNLMKLSLEAIYKKPPQKMLWYPNIIIADNYLYALLGTVFFHFLPAYILDGLLFILCKKPFMVELQKQFWDGLKLIGYFFTRDFEFRTTRMQALYQQMNSEDKDIFYGIHEFNINTEYFERSLSSVYKYFFKDDGQSQGRYLLLKILYVLNILLQLMVLYGAAWLTLYIFGMTKVLTLSYWIGHA